MTSTVQSLYNLCVFYKAGTI